MSSPNSAPLAGTRVLDLASGAPASVAAMMLADYGADVITVRGDDAVPAEERSNERRRRSATWDRGLRHANFDLADTGSIARLNELSATADVILIGPDLIGLPAGYSPRELAARRPDAVVTAFSAVGIDVDHSTPAYEPLIAAETGAMVAATAIHRDGPVFLGHPAITYSTGMVAVIGTLAGLRGRLLGGRGAIVDASVLDGVRALFTMNWWTARDVAFLAARRDDGQLDLGRTRMLVRRYVCSDGRMIQVHTGAAGAFGRLMNLLGVGDRISPATGPVENATPLTDEDLAIIDGLPAIFATRTSDEWLADIWANQIAALPVLAPGEAFDDGQVRANGLIKSLTDERLGEVEMVGPPIRLDASPAMTPTPSTRHDDQVTWQGAGITSNQAIDHAKPADAATTSTEGPLAGVRIAEFSSFFASPYANRLLRDLGADVLKIESTAGDLMRGLADPFEGACRGKRSLAVDLKAAESRPLVEAILRSVDVVQHNFRPGAAERLGLDDASVRAINPSIIYDYAPGYGSSGPKSSLQSFAPLHSGFVGINTEASGEGNIPSLTFGNEDYYNGLLNAIGILLALIHRDRTGDGQSLECAQLNSSIFVTSHWYLAGGARRSTHPQLDQMQFGWSPYQRMYQCLTGYVCVYATTPAAERAMDSVVLGTDPDPATQRDTDDHTNDHNANEHPDDFGRFDYEFFGRTADDWYQVLNEAGVPCAVVAEEPWLLSHLKDPDVQAAGRATAFEHHLHGPVSVVGQIVRLVDCEPLEPVRAPLLGEHSIDVMHEFGFSDDEVSRMVERGTVFVTTAPDSIDRPTALEQ